MSVNRIYSAQSGDNTITSREYASRAEWADCGESNGQVPAGTNHYIDEEFHIPLEDFVGSHFGRGLLHFFGCDRPNGPLPAIRHSHHCSHQNGTMLTLQRVAALRNAGVRYVEISLDSTYPDKHDTFRGVPGMWDRTVQGIKRRRHRRHQA